MQIRCRPYPRRNLKIRIYTIFGMVNGLLKQTDGLHEGAGLEVAGVPQRVGNRIQFALDSSGCVPCPISVSIEPSVVIHTGNVESRFQLNGLA